MDLFEMNSSTAGQPARVLSTAPLAVRMRPKNTSELVGQSHLLTPGSPLHRLITPGVDVLHTAPSSVILFGPPGTGKTTLAYLMAEATEKKFVELSAVTAGVKEVREVISAARADLLATGRETILFIDEVHRFSKSQQDALLPSVENRVVTLVAATTENPSFSVISPLLSRSILLTLQPLEKPDLAALLARAIVDDRGLAGSVSIEEEATEQILRFAGNDARKALTILEAAAATAISTASKSKKSKLPVITVEVVSQSIDQAAVRYDKNADQHYDVISAFIKSMRGSDVNAALHYLARMVVAGEDPRFIARRIVIAASEDVGMADPSALQTAVAAFQAVSLIGMPEARIILAQAVIHVATAPKSNAGYLAIDEAIARIKQGDFGLVPPHLRDAHYSGAKKLGHGVEYKYAHDYPHAVSSQQYLPDPLVGDSYYRPSDRGFENSISGRMEAIRKILDAES